MLRPAHVLRTFSWMTMALAVTAACGQNYPERPVHIVTSEPGGGNDFVTRVIAQQLAGNIGQPVIVDNRASVITVETVAKAPPDGYTLLSNGGIIWVEPMTRPNVSWDAVRDFSPVILVASSPNILVVHPSMPVKSVQDLIALAKANPGALNYSSAATGTSSHISAELFKSMAGVDIVRVSYKGTGPAVNDLVAGQVQLMFATSASVAPLLKTGRLRALAVTGAQPSALLPGLPAVASAGLPGYETATLYTIVAPAKTPDAIIRRINQDVTRVLVRDDVKEKLLSAGMEIAGGTPEQLAARIKSEIAALGRVIKSAGIRAD